MYFSMSNNLNQSDIFKSYQKISDKVDKYVLGNNNKLFHNKHKWVVTEKVHGANFSIYYNDGVISFAKRKELLKEDDWFYSYQLIKPQLEKNIKELSLVMNENNIVVYGELFGGYYPPDSSKWTGADGTRINSKGTCIVEFNKKAVQEGIYYSPHIEYMVFDVGIIKPNKEIHFVDYMDMMHYLNQTCFYYSKPLLICSYQSVSAYDINFNSTIPKDFGMTPLPLNTNIAEGIIIKPLYSCYIKNKSGEDVRCIIKKKNPKFLEISDEFDMNLANNSYQSVFIKLINQNRYNAVISKIGKLTISNKELVQKDLEEDTWDDFYLNHSNIQITDHNQATLFVRNLCINLVMLNINDA